MNAEELYKAGRLPARYYYQLTENPLASYKEHKQVFIFNQAEIEKEISKKIEEILASILSHV